MSNTNTEKYQKKDFLGNVDNDLAHGADSGFLSEPQNSFLEEHEDSKHDCAENIGNSFNAQNLNIDKLVHKTENLAEFADHCERPDEKFCIVDSGCIEEEECESNDLHVDTEHKAMVQHNTQSQDNKMKTKQNVDARISERFCNLSLQHDTINNLGGSGKDSNVDPEPATTTKSSAERNQLPAWEQCYQQNDEGDT